MPYESLSAANQHFEIHQDTSSMNPALITKSQDEEEIKRTYLIPEHRRIVQLCEMHGCGIAKNSPITGLLNMRWRKKAAKSPHQLGWVSYESEVMAKPSSNQMHELRNGLQKP